MLAMIAGTGDLPPALMARASEPVLVCGLDGFESSVPTALTFRLEHLGSFLKELQVRGITRICMAGAVERPVIDHSQIDAATIPLVPRIQQALSSGDDGALRELIEVIEAHDFEVVGADTLAPDLLPDKGVPTRQKPTLVPRRDAQTGEAQVAMMGQADIGQACIVRDGKVLAEETRDGTAALLRAMADVAPYAPGGRVDRSGILFKAPKPDQDRRADLPVIGPDTAKQAAEAGLAGIVIEAGGVMVLHQAKTISVLNAADMFLWVRPRGLS